MNHKVHMSAPRRKLADTAMHRTPGVLDDGITLFAGRNDLHLHEDFRLDQLSNDLEHERRSNIA